MRFQATITALLGLLISSCIPLPEQGAEGQKCFENNTCKGDLICRPDTGLCQQCAPDCGGRCEGADDGCGGTCDTVCPEGRYCDGASKECRNCNYSCTDKCPGADDGCGGSCEQDCPTGDYCHLASMRCEPCNLDCTGKCGGADDGCGGTCESCALGEDCEGQTCISCDQDLRCGDECIDCTAQITNLACIDGLSCGCLTSADCVADEGCVSGLCAQCQPDCAGKQCGPDGCGGECGDCGTDECNLQTNQCQLAGPPIIVSDNIRDAVVPAGTHRMDFQVTFSEPVTGLARGGVSIAGGAFLTLFDTSDQETWTFSAMGIHGGGQYTVSFGPEIMDLSGTAMELVTRQFQSNSGTIHYVREGASGFGNSPESPTGDLVNVMVNAQEGDEIFLAEGTYTTFLTIETGASFLCGFNYDFSVRDPETYVSTFNQNSLNSTMFTMHEFAGQTMDGCLFINNWNGGATLAPNNGITIINSSVLVTRNRIETRGNWDTVGIIVNGGSPVLIANHVDSEPVPSGQFHTGIKLSDSDAALVVNNTLVGGTGDGSSTGIDCIASNATIMGNNIYAGSYLGVTENNSSIGIAIDSCDPQVINNLIHGGTNKAHTRGIDCSNTAATISQNTIYAGDGSSSASAIRSDFQDSHPTITNNILFTSSVAGLGVEEAVDSSSASDPASVHNNLFLQCPDGMYQDEGVTYLSDPAAINALDNSPVEDSTCSGPSDCDHARYGGNRTKAITLGELFVDPDGPDDDLATVEDNDWRLLTVDPQVLQGGMNTFGLTCGTVENPATCGQVNMNLDGEMRGSIPSIGAY